MSTISLFLLSFFPSFLIILTAQPAFRDSPSCFNYNGNYTNPSAYHTNLNILLSNLTSNTKIDYGFYNVSHGQDADRVNAIGLCRGDVKPDACRSCLHNASILLPMLCPNQKEAIGYYDECILRYSNRSIFGSYQDPEFSFYLWTWNPRNSTDEAEKYLTVVDDLLRSLRSKAASGDSRRKFAAATARAEFQTIYGVVQCTPDLSEQDCSDCLENAISEVPGCCKGKLGGRVIKLSCNLRYENYRFFDLGSIQSSPPLPPSDPSTNTTSSQGNGNRSRTVIIVAVSLGAFIALVLMCIYFAVRKSMKTIGNETNDGHEIGPTEALQFDLDTIKLATKNFAVSNKLGQGGFGPVYKGRLSDGQEVAVKRLSMESKQGDLEFKNEVLLVAKLQHRNLVRLLGFCFEGKERLLVYEFLPNKSLDQLLFDPIQQAQLNWERRYKIIEGIARGLLYLHEDSRLRIIHRDLKASNILLDRELRPKISDFGMAKLFAMDQTQSNTSRIVGTYGYIAPEYAIHGQFSMKSDIFSFGVLVLEIVSGKKNNSIFHGDNGLDLLCFAWKNWTEGTITNMVDPVLTNDSRSEIMKCIHIGLLCVQENVGDRPTMASVVPMLSNYAFSLPLPSPPPLFNSTISLKDHPRKYSPGLTRSTERETNIIQESENEASVTELCPR